MKYRYFIRSIMFIMSLFFIDFVVSFFKTRLFRWSYLLDMELPPSSEEISYLITINIISSSLAGQFKKLNGLLLALEQQFTHAWSVLHLKLSLFLPISDTEAFLLPDMFRQNTWVFIGAVTRRCLMWLMTADVGYRGVATLSNLTGCPPNVI